MKSDVGVICALVLLVPASAPAQEPAAQVSAREGHQVDRAGLLADFALTLAAQQAYRLPRRDVRQHLDGPFWRDYIDSITHLQKGFWDGDQPWTWNLVIHPLMGGLSYHQARTRGASHVEAFVWTTAYSTHFELGVPGQAGLGNNRVSPFDLVFTPVAGALWAAFEEWIERRFLSDGKGDRLFRTLLPAHAMTNMLRGRAPWRQHPPHHERRTR